MNQDDDTLHEISKVHELVSRYQFVVLIAGSIIVSIVLVMASLALYVTSGTAQLDLSRPGYADIRGQLKKDDSFQGFRANGKLDNAAYAEFEKLYNERLKDAESVDAFGNDVLSPEALQILPAQ